MCMFSIPVEHIRGILDATSACPAKPFGVSSLRSLLETLIWLGLWVGVVKGGRCGWVMCSICKSKVSCSEQYDCVTYAYMIWEGVHHLIEEATLRKRLAKER